MRLSKKDLELMEIATQVVRDNIDLYNNRYDLTVGCAVRAKSGKIYKGINLKSSHSVCAEQVAIGQAFANGERELETIVSMKIEENGEPRVVSPCGLCRYIFDKFGLKFKVIVMDEETGETDKVTVKKLLPYPYIR